MIRLSGMANRNKGGKGQLITAKGKSSRLIAEKLAKGIVFVKAESDGRIITSTRGGGARAARYIARHQSPGLAPYSLKAKVTSKGQVTIPAPIRKGLNVKEGDEVVFAPTGGGYVLKKYTAIDRLSETIGPKLREEFPTPEDFDRYLKENRKKLFERIYGDLDIESSS